MSDAKTGGFAFPWVGDLNEHPTINLGMTLRDYFAAKAMPALQARYYGDVECDDIDIARMAYDQADAMLRARAGE